MGNWTFFCWHCGNATEMVDKVARLDRCPHCHKDMHSCMNCEHYDLSRPERCCDDSYPKVTEAEKANFSSQFTPRTKPLEKEHHTSTREQLEKMFSKLTNRSPK